MPRGRKTRSRRIGIISALQRAARAGSASAAFLLARLYDEGWGVPPSQSRAFQWYRQAAKGGLPESFYFVATAYHCGYGVRTNQKRAFEWFTRASKAGDLLGEYMRALCVWDGVGTRQDSALGIRLMRQTARRGSAPAMDYLAAHYLTHGRLEVARRWAIRAARAGDLVAPLRVAEIERKARERP